MNKKKPKEGRIKCLTCLHFGKLNVTINLIFEMNSNVIAIPSLLKGNQLHFRSEKLCHRHPEALIRVLKFV